MGFEPIWSNDRGILSPVRMPIPPHLHTLVLNKYLCSGGLTPATLVVGYSLPGTLSDKNKSGVFPYGIYIPFWIIDATFSIGTVICSS